MHMRLGWAFYFSPRDLPPSTRDHAIFIKYGMTEFSSFRTHENFYEWFIAYREDCEKHHRAFKIFELIIDGKPTAFYSDIEGTSPLDATEDELLRIRHDIKVIFRQKYALMGGDPDRLIWMEDHREHKGLQKTSFHVIGPDCKFVDVKNHGSMRVFADKLNDMITPEFVALGLNINIWDKNRKIDSVMDMSVYHSQRPIRTIFSSKYVNERGFVLCEECRYYDFKDCFINLNIPPDQLEDNQFITMKKGASSKPKISRGPVCPVAQDHDVIHIDSTLEHAAAMKRITHILTTKYNHQLKDIKFTGLYMGQDQYRVDGIRECPVCDFTHDSNGAYIRDLQNGQYMYKCLTSGVKNKGPVCIGARDIGTIVTEESQAPEESKYLQSLLGIEQKCIAVCAGMGVGKTHRIIEYLQSIPLGEPVLWLIPRVAMGTSLLGRLEGLGFKSYKETTRHYRLVMEIESLHKVFMYYPNIIMDEGRSLTASLVSYETNGDNLLEHINDLKDLCQNAKKVLIVGADINIDGAVPDFIDDVFEEDQVHRIDHVGKMLSWHHVFVHGEDFYTRLYKSIEDGERVSIVCGASSDLKDIEIAASRIIERKKMVASGKFKNSAELDVAVSTIEKSDKIGAYHAECEIKHELEDVNTTWAKYQVILYTSTITVSVDYQGEIDRVYSIPDTSTANDREGNQMAGRNRNNKHKEVIIRYDGPCITPRLPNDDVIFKAEMSKIMTKRKFVNKTMTGYEREISKSLTRKGFGYQATYAPTLATKLHVWSKVEEYKKLHDWYGSYLALLKSKGETWEFASTKSTGPSPIDTEIHSLDNCRRNIIQQQADRVLRARNVRSEIKELPLEQRKEARLLLTNEKAALDNKLKECRSQLDQKKIEKKEKDEEDTFHCKESRKRKKEIRDREQSSLDATNTLEVSQKELNKRKHRKYGNTATREDHLVLKKDEVQRYFGENLTGEDVKFFNKNKRAIFNRALYIRYPRKVRHKLHANNIEMSIADEYVNMDTRVLDVLDTIVGELGLESVTDVSHFDWAKMVKDNTSGNVSSGLDTMDKMTGVEHACSDDLSRMRHYFKKVLGYNIASYVTKTQVNGKRTSYTTYYLSDTLCDVLERPNKILDADWFQNQCDKYDRFVMDRYTKSNDEQVYMKSLWER